MSADGWVFTCGCGNEVSVKNAGVVCSTDGCERCADVIAGKDDGFDPLDYLIGQELGWCGCGDPSLIDRLMLDYLGQDRDVLWCEGDAQTLVAYIADERGWTEHGSSLVGAWLTDDGKTALANLRLHLARRQGLSGETTT